MAKQTTLNKGLKIFIGIIALICLVLDGWFAYIHFFGKEITVSTTVTASDMEVERVDPDTGEVVKEQKTFLEVNCYDNCIEIKFNQLFDENQTSFYSYGIQLMTKDGVKKTLSDEDIFDGNYSKEIYSELAENDKKVFESLLYLQKCKIYHDVYNKVLTNKNYTNLDLYEYQSFDDFETPLQSTFLQDGENLFKIQAKDGDNKKILGLEFKNFEKETEEIEVLGIKIEQDKLITNNLVKVGTALNFNYEKNGFFSITDYYDEITYYRALDIYYLIESIAKSVSGLAPGFVGETYLRMPDVFNLKLYNENNGRYEQIGGIDNIDVHLTSNDIVYSKIKLTVHEGNLTKSSQSIFNKYREYQNYDSDPSDVDMTNYLTGRNLIEATLDDLTWEASDVTGEYTFSLSEDFKNKWNLYKNTSFIKVVIDSDFLTENGLTYAGFEFDNDFFVYQIKTTQNEILYQGVNYV